MKRSLSKIMMVLALGAIFTMPGIVSCKKSNSSGGTSHQIYPNQLDSNQLDSGSIYSGQNYHVGHAPVPSTLLLLGSGLAGLGFMGWRKRNKP